jgi:hypothetical protein
MKSFWYIIIVLAMFSCTNSQLVKPLNINSLTGKYELVKIYNHATCCNGGESTVSEFEKVNSIQIDENSITEFDENTQINKFSYEKKTELIADKEATVLNILNLNNANKTIFQTIGWMQKLIVSEKDNYLILSVRWGKEGELTDYYFKQK